MRRCTARHLGALILFLALAATACTDSGHTSEGFCDKLGEITGAGGVEATFAAGDPARIDGVVIDLAELHDRAPDEISTTTRTLLTFFLDYQRAARDERRDVIADSEALIAQASANLDAFALAECGLLLQRTVPTAIPTVNPALDAPDE